MKLGGGEIRTHVTVSHQSDFVFLFTLRDFASGIELYPLQITSLFSCIVLTTLRLVASDKPTLAAK